MKFTSCSMDPDRIEPTKFLGEFRSLSWASLFLLGEERAGRSRTDTSIDSQEKERGFSFLMFLPSVPKPERKN